MTIQCAVGAVKLNICWVNLKGTLEMLTQETQLSKQHAMLSQTLPGKLLKSTVGSVNRFYLGLSSHVFFLWELAGLSVLLHL